MNLLKGWNAFSAQWKEVHHEYSERAVHDCRVATRRLIAKLELVAIVTRSGKHRDIIRKLRKTLKRLGPLRDIQVHMRRAHRDHSDTAIRFSRFLQEQEKKEIRRVRKRMPEKSRKAIRRGVWSSNQRLQAVLDGTSRPVLQATAGEHIQKRLDAVARAYASFKRSPSPEKFHRMRVKFKRFRYAAEAAKPVAEIFTDRQFDRMRKLQKVMGEINDLQIYMAALAEWFGKPVPAALQKELDTLLKAFNNNPRPFEEFNFSKRTNARTAKA
jgi:triphosphatase